MACSNSLSLYVGDLCPEVNEDILFKIFSNIGEVTHVRVCRDRITKRSRGYAYVNFKNHEDSKKALRVLNYEPIMGKPCRVMWQERDRNVRGIGFGNLYIKNFDKSVDSKALDDMFSEFGEILSCKVATDENGESRGFGYVHFKNQRDGERAIERMHGKSNNGKNLFVCKFKGREERHVVNEKDLSKEEDIPLNPLIQPVLPVRNLGDVTYMRKMPQRELRSQGEVHYERKSLRDRVESLEIMANAVLPGEHAKVNSRCRSTFKEREKRSRSVPRRRTDFDGSAQADSDNSDEDNDRDTVLSDAIYEVARKEHPNEANLIVKLVREKCVGDKLSVLLDSRALIENEVEKAYKKIQMLESPTRTPKINKQ